jgi:hypothetical protein
MIIDQGSDVHIGAKMDLLMLVWIHALEQLGVNCHMTYFDYTVFSSLTDLA